MNSEQPDARAACQRWADADPGMLAIRKACQDAFRFVVPDDQERVTRIMAGHRALETIREACERLPEPQPWPGAPNMTALYGIPLVHDPELPDDAIELITVGGTAHRHTLTPPEPAPGR